MLTLNTQHSKRLLFIITLLIGITTATALVLYALSQNINLFYTPTEVSEHQAPIAQTIRLGGMIKEGSIIKHKNLKVNFTVTDYNKNVEVSYQGILPDLFREGQGVVMLGQVESNGTFKAQEVLAKHDETYMPPEVKDAIDKAKLKAMVESAA